MSTVHSDISDTDLTYDGENTSNYALQVALKTMRERCQALQNRLTAVEDENCSLRLKSADTPSLTNDSSKTDVEILQDRIAQLTKQKSQLAHNVYMVAAENRHLWSRLSKLTDANISLGSQLLKINDTLNQHKEAAASSPPPTSNLIRSKTFTQNSPRTKHKAETDGVSLEEISLKLIDSFLKEKNDLEEQYAQMVKLQSDSHIDVNSIGFAYPDENEEDESIYELKKCSDQLLSFKSSLLSQQDTLKTALDNLKRIKTEGSLCKRCQDKGKTHSEIPLLKTSEIFGKEINTETSNKAQHKLCPVCGDLFFQSMSMLDFEKHVENHFMDDSISDNYEIITLET